MVRLILVVMPRVRRGAAGVVMLVLVRVVMQEFVLESLTVRVRCVWNFLSFHGAEHHGVIQNQQQGDEDFLEHGG